MIDAGEIYLTIKGVSKKRKRLFFYFFFSHSLERIRTLEMTTTNVSPASVAEKFVFKFKKEFRLRQDRETGKFKWN